MNIHKAIEFIDKQISNPSEGLPDEVFYFTSKITPLVNVDLLTKDENGRILLSWRDDEYVGVGWHLPGGIIRFKEKLETRILKVAELEMGTTVEYDPVPIDIVQTICEHETRGHFISILYKCFLNKEYVPKNEGLSDRDNGYVKWHDSCPDNIVKVHDVYRQYM